MPKKKQSKPMKPKKPTPKKTKVTKKKTSSSKWSILLSKPVLFVLFFALIGAWLLIRSQAVPPSKAGDARTVPDQILVRFRPGSRGEAQSELKQRYKMDEVSDIPQIEVKVFKVNPKAKDAILKALSNNPNIEFAESDVFYEPQQYSPDDPYYTGTATPYNTKWPYLTTNTDDAWQTTTGIRGTVIAILDTGITPTLPDVGYMVPGRNVVNDNSDITDIMGHGTSVSGIANARTNNAAGVASVCGDCSVMPVRISTSTSGTAQMSTIAKGIIWAADNGANIINISFGASGSVSTTLNSAEQYAFSKNIMIFAAAGNSACDCPTSPATDPGVIGVALLGGQTGDYIQGNSNYGNWVDIAAPNAYSTRLDGTYTNVGGTSHASPFAAAVAGLLKSAKPTATTGQIEQAIFSTTIPITHEVYPGRFVKYGRIDAKAALDYILSSTPPPSDSTAPSTSLTSPAPGTSLSGETTVTVNATDNTAVSKVELYRNGVLYATDTTSPYSFYWNTTSVANGSYSFVAKAYDAAGNVGTSSTVTYTVNNGPAADTTPPTAQVTAPANGATVSGTTNASGSATDNVSVTSTELYIDGLLRASNPGSSVTFSWNTTQETNGSHIIQIKAVDAAGNVGSSSTRTVTVSNSSEGTPPVVTIQSPLNGFIITENTTTVRATATDNVGVVKMEVLIDGRVKASSTSGSLTYNWKTNKGLKAGSHTVRVRAYDAAGNVGQYEVRVSK